MDVVMMAVEMVEQKESWRWTPMETSLGRTKFELWWWYERRMREVEDEPLWRSSKLAASPSFRSSPPIEISFTTWTQRISQNFDRQYSWHCLLEFLRLTFLFCYFLPADSVSTLSIRSRLPHLFSFRSNFGSLISSFSHPLTSFLR